jgi:Putative peptidoglycan binding domain
VQLVLIQEGFLTGQPTGVFDEQTREALITFQRQKGIELTGTIDARTVTELGLSGRINTTGASTTGQGPGALQQQQPGQSNDMSGQQMPQQNPSTTGQGQTAPQQPAQQHMGNQGANQPSAQTPQENRSTTGQAPSGGMQQQPPAAQNQPMSGQGNAQPPAAAPQNQNRQNR